MTTTLCNKQRNPAVQRLLFHQLRHNVATGTLAVSDETALLLAAIVFQMNFGNPSPTNHRSGFIPMGRIQEYIPTHLMQHHIPTEWEQLIFTQHQTYYDQAKDKSALNSLLHLHINFYTVCAQQDVHQMLGNELFQVKQCATLPDLPNWVDGGLLLGIHENGISYFNPQTNAKYKTTIPLSSLKTWGYTPQKSFWFTLKSPAQTFEFETIQGDLISTYLTNFATVLLHASRTTKQHKSVVQIQTLARGFFARLKFEALIVSLEVRLKLAIMEIEAQGEEDK